MIVPRTRLLGWVALAFVPFATLATATQPPARGLAEAILCLFVLVVAADAVLGYGSLDGIGVDLPAVVRLTKDRAGSIEVRLRNDTNQPMGLRLGLAFPSEVRSSQEDLILRLPEQSQFSRVLWPCTPARRGVYHLDGCHLEARSPLGFWAVRAVRPARAEIRVYPNLRTERQNLAALFLHRGRFGIHTQRQVGQGRDFEKLRDYIPGDALNEIHWKATAKRSRPVTKVFQIEKTQEVYVVIDASRLSARSSAFGVQRSEFRVQHSRSSQLRTPNSELRTAGPQPPTPESVLERYVTAALVVGLVAEQQGDRFGLLTFSDKVQSFVRAKNGKEHYGACRDALYRLHPQMVTPDFGNLGSFLRLRLRRRALLLVLTHLDDPVLAESFVRQFDLVRRQHLVLVNILRPGGARPLFTDPAVDSVDDLYQRLGGHIRWHNLRELERVLHRRGVGFAQLDDERLSVELVSQYLNVKQRQLL